MRLPSFLTRDQNNLHNTTHVIGVNRFESEDYVEQSFIASDSHLASISIQLSTCQGRAEGSIRIQINHIFPFSFFANLRKTRSTSFYDQSAQLSELFDEEFFEAKFDAIEDSKNQKFTVRIDWIPANRNDAAGYLLSKRSDDSPFPNARINGIEADSLSLSLIPHYALLTVANPCPPGLMISPVTRCDLNCVYCISKETRKTLSEISPQVLEDIKRLADEGSLQNAMNDYSGDIFFSDEKHGGYLDYMNELGIPYAISTHANRLSDESIRQILESKLTAINFSLDAASAETYRRIRRGSKSLPFVHERIKAFLAKQSDMDREDVVCSLSMVLMKSNAHEMLGMMDFAAEVGISQVYGSHLHAYSDDLENESMFYHQERFNELWYAIHEKATQLELNVAMPRRFESKPIRTGHRHCPLPWNSAILCGNGDLMACCVPTTVMGNVNTQPIEEIWNGPEYQELRRRVNSDDPPEVCKHCPVYKIESNPTSFFFNRVKPKLKMLRQEMRQSIDERATQR